eukprot:2228695-Pyramimonas_sp.AAC.1
MARLPGEPSVLANQWRASQVSRPSSPTNGAPPSVRSRPNVGRSPQVVYFAVGMPKRATLRPSAPYAALRSGPASL